MVEEGGPMKTILPKFEEIQKGYCVYEIEGRYLGEDEYGNPRFARRKRKRVHLGIDNYLQIFIVLNKKYEPESFIYGKTDKTYSYIFSYSKEGYKKMVDSIIETMNYDKEKIEAIVDNITKHKDGL